MTTRQSGRLPHGRCAHGLCEPRWPAGAAGGAGDDRPRPPAVLASPRERVREGRRGL